MMKREHLFRWISVFGVIALLSGFFVFSIGALSEDQSADEPSSEAEMEDSNKEIVDIIAAQTPGREAYTEFLSHIPVDEEGNYRYPDDFGGAYLDPETQALCITLTDCSEEKTSAYDAYFSDPSRIVYREAEYSYNELLEFIDVIMNTYDQICTIGISEQKNVIEIGISGDAAWSQAEIEERFPVEIYCSGPIYTASDPSGGDQQQ